MGDWAVGDRCQIGGRVGNIVYVGPTQFAPGEWIGIVLDHPLGKNDGSVDGHRYFSVRSHLRTVVAISSNSILCFVNCIVVLAMHAFTVSFVC